jgi:hypothetical protein
VNNKRQKVNSLTPSRIRTGNQKSAKEFRPPLALRVLLEGRKFYGIVEILHLSAVC